MSRSGESKSLPYGRRKVRRPLQWKRLSLPDRPSIIKAIRPADAYAFSFSRLELRNWVRSVKRRHELGPIPTIEARKQCQVWIKHYGILRKIRNARR